MKIIIKILAIFLLIQTLNVFAKTENPIAELGTISPIIKSATPAVVNITVHGEINPNPLEKPMDTHHSETNKFVGTGSGVIVNSKKGYILTNAHVVRNATKITVNLNDGRKIEAKSIGADPATDVAVIQVKADHLTKIPFGNSDNIDIGDFVAAIGNPFSLNKMVGSNQTVTFGIISALQRSEFIPGGYYDFIQTDAAMNVGSSGGALINMKGELIGITTAFITPTTAPLGNVGIGFAIPINMAQSIMDQLIKFGSIKRGFLGVIVQKVSPDLAKAFNLKETKGVIVTQVNKNTPAKNSDIAEGDIILSVNGKIISDANQFRNLIVGEKPIGTTLTFSIVRNGKPLSISATTTDLTEYEQNQKTNNPYFYKVALLNHFEKSPIHGIVQGIQIQSIAENTPALYAGLLPGDIIVEINKAPVNDIQELQDAVYKNKKEGLLVRAIRGQQSLFAVIKKE